MSRIRTIKPEFQQSESIDARPRNWRGHFKKATVPAAVRRAVAERYGAGPGKDVPVKCHYCDFVGSIGWYVYRGSIGRKNAFGWPMFGYLEMDHVDPEYHGGETTAENIVLACRPCNRSKGSKRQWRGN